MGTSAKFQTRQHTIEAVQFDGTEECAERINDWSDGMASPLANYNIHVLTPESTSIAKRGDWIVKDEGGFWVCNAEIFQRKYEAV